MKIYSIISSLFILLLFTSCEDVIDVNLDENIPQLVVDAWLNDKPEEQHIYLTTTSPYFNSNAAPAVTNATVIVTDDNGNTFSFLDNDNDGTYTWTPNTQQNLGPIGTFFTLTVIAEGQTYTANTVMNRVTPIDSITYEFRDDELGGADGIYAELFARDFTGIGDAYWIKTWKNGQYLNKPQEINIAYDAGLSVGAEVAGIPFIVPIRESINPVNDEDDDELPPYEVGDSIYVEIHSINLETFLFLEEAFTQMTLGDNSIFAEPPANVSTNIINNDPASKQIALGFFNVAAVSTKGIKVE